MDTENKPRGAGQRLTGLYSGIFHGSQVRGLPFERKSGEKRREWLAG
jgi:hypothetical protein